MAQSTADAQAGEIGPESLDDVLQVAVRRDGDLVDLAAPRRRLVDQRLDLFLLSVGQLLSVAIEELHAVVLGRVVRCRDDAAEIERQQCDSRGRKHAGDDRVTPDGGDPTRECVLQLGPGCARVASDEDPAAAAPERRGTAETFDELRGDVLADDATDPVRAEVSTRQHYRLLNCGALRALCRPAFLRSTMRASRVRKPARLSGMRNSGSASTSARAMP